MNSLQAYFNKLMVLKCGIEISIDYQNTFQVNGRGQWESSIPPAPPWLRYCRLTRVQAVSCFKQTNGTPVCRASERKVILFRSMGELDPPRPPLATLLSPYQGTSRQLFQTN